MFATSLRRLVAASSACALLASIAEAAIRPLPQGQQAVQTLGTGCGGLAGVGPSLGVTAPLSVGNSTTLVARNMRSPAMGMLLQGWSGDRWSSVGLPLALGFVGMDGCELNVRPDTSSIFVSPASFAQWTIGVPASPVLQGQSLFSQVMFVDPTANARGFGMTPGLRTRIDPPGTPTTSVSQVTQWGITFVFDRPVQAGQFVNGDWFVLGPVRVVDTLPRVTTTAGGRVLNGAMVDPDASTTLHGYDSELFAQYASDYRSNLNAALNVSTQSPLLLQPGQRIIKVISHTASPTVATLRTAAVLTVLATAPPVGSFRPPYAGPDAAVRYHEGMLEWSRLAALQPAAGRPSFTELEQKLERVWLDHCPSWVGRLMHPVENMPDYGRDLAAVIGDAALLANCNFTQTERRNLVIRLVQIGIDNYGCLRGGCRWPGLGGHGSGRKLPILFAGRLLGDADMLAIGTRYVSQRQPNGAATSYFGEDTQTFMVAETAPGVFNYGHGNYTRANVGQWEWGFAHTHSPQSDNVVWTADPYRVCCTVNAWAGHVLTARIMGLRAAWNHAPLFQYTDLYLQRETTAWHRAWSPWTEAMWDLHRPQF